MGLIVFLLMINIMSPQVEAQGGGHVGVLNVAPTFRYVELVQLNGVYLVKIIPYDSNGWADIDKVVINITSANNGVVSLIEFRQYGENGNNTNRSNEFVDVIGGWMVGSRCEMEYTNNTESGMDVCSFTLSVIIHPVNGNRVNITVYDKRGSFSQHKGPFTLNPPNPAVYIIMPVSLFLAGVLGFVAVWNRYKSNRLAKIIERGGYG
jgi:hypothetical protein